MLWVITSYFNPAGFESRRQNYRAFRQRLRTPLVAVELSFDGQFELQADDADILVQRKGGDVMWQKERLLNVALQSLPPECDVVAWIDCDVIFEREDWAAAAVQMLRSKVLVQLFEERHDLPPMTHELHPVKAPYLSLCCAWCTGAATVEDFTATSLMFRRLTGGLAWASRREILDEHGLYDGCILGSGDKAMMYAAVGEFEWTRKALMMNSRSFEHYLAWASPYYRSVGKQVCHIPGRAYHLWHGDRTLRRTPERKMKLASFEFDPFIDIRLDEQGCWRWASDKPGLHAYAREYFKRRQEDGVPSGRGCPAQEAP